MATHITARLAWHNDGWNGHICQKPASNTYCVGPYSYPGDMISEKRDLALETKPENCGKPISKVIPPCIYSANAFGTKTVTAFSDPPEFFRDSTKQKRWELPPATVCIWPYEEMYGDEVRSGGRFDYDVRLDQARSYFGRIQNGKSLIFYYTNYSNPFSEDERRRYVLVGLSRVEKVGDELFYEGCSEETKNKYAGGFVWQRNITSRYPDEGLRIPYHRYRDKPDILDQILLTPDNPRNCKYGSRQLTDDDALGLVEQFLGVAALLLDIKDTSEDWSIRIKWLQGLVAELWKGRGLYPGLPGVLKAIGFEKAIPFFKEQVALGKEEETKDIIFAYLSGKIKKLPGLEIGSEDSKKLLRQWKLLDDEQRVLLHGCLPRFDLDCDQIKVILSEKRDQHGLTSSFLDTVTNPYTLAEEYVGGNPDDIIPWGTIDRGIFPSPELGGQILADMELDDSRRLRSLCVERLKRLNQHTFLSATQVIHDVNKRLSYLPGWKRTQYKERYFEVDEEVMSGALVAKLEGGKRYIYPKTVFEDERFIEERLRSLASGPNISFRSPVTKDHWHGFLYDGSGALAKTARGDYEQAIQGQINVCQKVFVRPLSVLSGAAGTGKTTVIKAIIRAIKKGHGVGTSVITLAPTGKAADRIREILENDGSLRGNVETATIHSFLARQGWLNPNLTFKQKGGEREEGYATYVIDESSMLDLSLAATLLRAINWSSVQRLILVGDPNQLPPIGRGKVFADIIDWLESQETESIAKLEINLRQMENRVRKCGTGILDLAELYTRKKSAAEMQDVAAPAMPKNETTSIKAEQTLRKVQEGGDIDKDLRVIYWNDPRNLGDLLIQTITNDMEKDTGQKSNEDRPFELWRAAFNDRPEYMQVLSPYRGELYGIEALNTVCQTHVSKRMLDRVGHIQGITLFDKVIQIRNRPKSDQIYAFDLTKKVPTPIEIYNGEIGFVKPHGFDAQKWMGQYFSLKHFQVVFARKKNFWVGYGQKLGQDSKGKWLPIEPVEDNLELAYAISVHKAQGSEFDRVYIIIPGAQKSGLSPELFYTALTRGSKHCTIFIEKDISPLLSMRRLERSHLLCINSSLFAFKPVPEALLFKQGWYEEGKIHQTLADKMVRSKSEVIIANMLFERDIPFDYEVPCFAPDGTFYLPDFTITWRGEKWYWEHLGLMHNEEYRNHWETKKAWYEEFFPGRLVMTEESGELSQNANRLIQQRFA